MQQCHQDMAGSPVQMPFMPFHQQQPDTPVTSRLDYSHFPQLDPSSLQSVDPRMGQVDMWTNATWLFMQQMQQMHNYNNLNTTPSSISSGNDSGFLSSPEENQDDMEQVAKVQGRLNLNNNPRQYPVTKSEVRRRLGEPERMNSSTMAAYLRKAKVKGGGRDMRDSLIKQGITLPHQSKKKETDFRPTCFSALLEEESLVMAQELQELTQKHFPKEEMISTLINQSQGGILDIQELAKEAVYAERFLRRLFNLSCSVQVPVAKCQYQPRQDPLYQQMYRFSNYTHGFGYLTHRTWLNVFQQIAGDMSAKLQQNGVSLM